MMMNDTPPLRSVTPTIDIYIKLAQYPILADKIRVRMREELFRRGIISQAEFEREVKELAIESQRREGLPAPYTQEEQSTWELRQERIRDFHTDAYFANNLGSALLEQLVNEVLRNASGEQELVELTFNPEIAPWELLFRQGEIYESMPEPERHDVRHHLEEIKVVLIKRMISDQLPYIGIAKKVFSIADLRHVYRRRIGGGKIGGKAAGMLLAWKILQQRNPAIGPDISHFVHMPDSFFISSEVIYEFNVINNLDQYMNQKYRSDQAIRSDYPEIAAAYQQGKFPENVVDRLEEVLVQFEGYPLIVRSSSLLEDNFACSLAGKYSSFFLANQGTEEENLQDLLDAIRRIYASLVNPEALLYRKLNNLIDYDERMSILLQRVEGQQIGRYFLPMAAGVAYSQNPFRWHPRIRRADGFLRLVWGFGTRAVNRIVDDYPRLVALSHPQLRPDNSIEAIRRFSQEMVDVLNLAENCFETVPVSTVLGPDYPALHRVASVDHGDTIRPVQPGEDVDEDDKLLLTFDGLLRDSRFVKLMRTALLRLEEAYERPIDMEFTVEVVPNYSHEEYRLHVVQCRPLSQRTEDFDVTIPADIPEEDVLLVSHWLVPDGRAENIRYLVFVDPEAYRRTADLPTKEAIAAAIGLLNEELADKSFALLGPGRWGSTDINNGVQVAYVDIYNSNVLVEIGEPQEDRRPELSYGTHFFQDLVETGIHLLALRPDAEHGRLQWDFLRETASCLGKLLPEQAHLAPFLRVIDVPAVTRGRYFHLLMDGRSDKAVGFLGEQRPVAQG